MSEQAKKLNPKEILQPALSLFLFCLIVTALLAGTNLLTKDKIAEQERLTIRKRQQEGIRVAKAKGKHLGRPRVRTPDNFSEVYSSWKREEITAVQAMQELGLSGSTFYRMVRAYENTDSKSQ